MAESRQADANQKDTQARKRKPPVAKMAAPAAQALDPALVQLALVDPASAPQASILHLQRSSGNRAVDRLIQRSMQSAPFSARATSTEPAAQLQPDASHWEAATPSRLPAPAPRGPLARPAKPAVVHPNRGTLAKAETLNRPKSLLPVVQLKPSTDPLPLASEAEGVAEIAAGQTYVPPVAPPPTPPNLPKGKPNKSPLLIQAKLTVGPAHDRYEQEADRVADRVMRISEPGYADVRPDEEQPVGRAGFNSETGSDTTPNSSAEATQSTG